MKRPTYKEVKNPDSKGGRKDWDGRTPRVRVSLTHPQLAVLSEIFNDYFNRHPDKAQDAAYADLADRINEALQDIDKPLLKEVESAGLWDDDE